MIRTHLYPINRVMYFWIQFRFHQDIRSQSLKCLTPWCAWHLGVNILGLVKPLFIIKIFSFMIDMFTPKRGLLIFPLEASRDQRNFRFWLWGVHHTVDLDSSVWCILQTPRYDAHSRVFWEIWVTWLRRVMHTTKLDSTEGCNSQSLTLWYASHLGVRQLWNCPFSCFTFNKKMSEIKRFPTQFMTYNIIFIVISTVIY